MINDPAKQAKVVGCHRFSFVELLIAVVILALVIVGTSMFFVTGRGTLHKAGVKRAVIERVADKTEQQLISAYEPLQGTETTTVNIGGTDVTIEVDIVADPPNLPNNVDIKKAVVTAEWSIRGKSQQTRMVTYCSNVYE